MLFARGSSVGLRLIILLIVSVALMVWNYRHPFSAQKWRQHLSWVTTPVMYVADSPFALFDSLAKNLESHSSLINENTTLHAQNMILQGQLQKLQSLQSENAELRALLKSLPVSNQVRLMLAQVMAIQLTPYAQEVMLNKGSNDDVFVGQAVLDSQGIMGQVIDVTPFTARVLLLTDTRSGIPIQNNRTGLHGILMGQGNSGLLNWINVPPTADVKVGDVLFSSGLGGHYPVGYPVGVVTHVNPHTQDQLLEIIVAPSARMTSSEQVLLMWPDKKAKK